MVGAVVWWRHGRAASGAGAASASASASEAGGGVGDRVCGMFDTEDVGRAAGVEVEWDVGDVSPGDYGPQLCTLSFTDFARMRVGYLDEPWFMDMASIRNDAERFRATYPGKYGWSWEEVDLGLDGHTYLTIAPLGQRESDVAYIVWYSDSGRTLLIADFSLDDEATPTERIRSTMVGLMQYFAGTVLAQYPPAVTPAASGRSQYWRRRR